MSEAAKLIEEAAELIRPGKGEAVFYIRVGGEYSQLRTFSNDIDPQMALAKAISVLADELSDVGNCPYHSRKEPTP